MAMPSGTGSGPTFFDRFATTINGFTSRSWFFLACVLLVLVWLPTLFILPVDSSQLLINTPTTVITFLLVALQSNTSKRSDAALQTKLNAIAEGLSLLLNSDENGAEEARELRKAVGLEDKEST